MAAQLSQPIRRLQKSKKFTKKAKIGFDEFFWKYLTFLPATADSNNLTTEKPKFAKSYHYESRSPSLDTSPCPDQSEDLPTKKWNIARFLTLFEMLIFMTYLFYFLFRINAWPFFRTINELSKAFSKTGAIILLCVWIFYLFLEQYGNGNQKNKINIISCVTRLISTILTLGYFIYIFIYKM